MAHHSKSLSLPILLRGFAGFMHHLFLFLLLSAAICSQSVAQAAALSPADSIRRVLPSLKGEDRIIAYSNLCRLASSEDNLKMEISALYDFIREAHRQKRAEYEGSGRSMLIMCYYNNDLSDSLFSAIGDHMKFMAEHELWDYYYNVWDVKAEQYIYEGKIQTALREAKAMYKNASERKIGYGLGVSTYVIGMVYQTMERYQLARDYLKKSVHYLKKEEDISLLLSAYNVSCETLDQLKDYPTMLHVAADWKKTIDRYKHKAESQGKVPALNGRYMYCYMAYATAYLGTKHLDRAKQYLDKAEVCAKDRKAIAKFKLLSVMSLYYEQLGNYGKALAFADSVYTLTVNAGDSISALTVMHNKARILSKMGEGGKAAALYETVMKKRDLIRNLDIAAQLDELQTIYSVDQLTLQRKKAFLGMTFAIVGCLLLALLLVTFIIYNKKLREKNRHLYEMVQQKIRGEEPLAFDSEPGDESLKKKQELFAQLNRVVDEKQAYTNPNLDRKELAVLLGTNETYLADAIRTCSGGLTVAKYLNVLRTTHAGKMLIEDHHLPVDVVAANSGFSSRSSFYRMFKEHYGMTPAEFISISREKERL